MNTVKRYRRPLVTVLTVLIVGGSLFFLFGQVQAGWDELKQVELSLDARWLLLALVFQAFSFAGSIMGWHFALRYVGAPSNVLSAARGLSYSALTRYLPGGIWALTSRVYLAQQAGATTTQAAVAQTVELLVLLASSVVMAVLGLLSAPTIGLELDRWWFLIPILFIGASIAIHPRILRWVLAYRWPGRQNITPLPPNRHFGHALLLIGYYLPVWMAGGGAIYCLTRAWIPDMTPPFFVMVGSWAAAWLIGFLALPAPGGLGIRESALTILLAPFMPTGIAATLSILTRLWTTLLEVVLALVVAAVDWAIPSAEEAAPNK